MSSECSLLQRFWAALRAGLIGCGLAEPLLRLGRLGLTDTRRHLARYYLTPPGTGWLGLEIGALHCPLPLPPGADALYIDKHLPVALKTLRPDVQDTAIVTPDFIANGFSLQCIADACLDFVIANHVLEHSIDALGTLCQWLRVLRPDGILFVAVPLGDRCFDRGRPLTSPDHFVEDYRLSARGERAAMRERNLRHVEEYLAISAPAIAREQGATWAPPDTQERARLIGHLLDVDPAQMHHHVFSVDSFATLLGLLDEICGRHMLVERIARSSVEIIGIVRKLA